MLLETFLRDVESRYHRAEFLRSDPVEFVHRFTDPWDQEAVAVLAAVLAYGNVKQIRASVEGVLGRMHAVAGAPGAYVRLYDRPSASKTARAALKGFVHRFNQGADLALLFELVARSWREHGSVGAHFVASLEPDAPDCGAALDRLVADWLGWAGRRAEGSFRYLLTAPSDGSCCKRWCMFLRWMGRRDPEIDPGLWTREGALASTFPPGRFLEPRQLVMPLDTHTGRISRELGLTSRKSLNWRAALEVTEALRAADPNDPVRFDFALCRLGMLGGRTFAC